MKVAATFLFCLVSLLGVAQGEPEMQTDTDGCLIFKMPEGDTVYTMKQYYMVFYKSGPNRDQSTDEAAEIQEGHMAHLNQLVDDGYLSIAGPFGDDTELRGILIFNVPTLEKVEVLMQGDPAVLIGRLIYEIHPWWSAKGSRLN